MNMRKAFLLFCATLTVHATAFAQPSVVRRVADPIPGHFIVVLRENADAVALGAETAGLRRGRVTHVYNAALRGFAAEMTEAAHTGGAYRLDQYWPLRCRGQRKRGRRAVVTSSTSADTLH